MYGSETIVKINKEAAAGKQFTRRLNATVFPAPLKESPVLRPVVPINEPLITTMKGTCVGFAGEREDICWVFMDIKTGIVCLSCTKIEQRCFELGGVYKWKVIPGSVRLKEAIKRCT